MKSLLLQKTWAVAKPALIVALGCAYVKIGSEPPLPSSHRNNKNNNNQQQRPLKVNNQQEETHPFDPKILPLWDPSSKIDNDSGFLYELFMRTPGDYEKELLGEVSTNYDETKSLLKDKDYTPVLIRQVPGDGNCLFHALALCLEHAVNGTHLNIIQNFHVLNQTSFEMRQQAVNYLLEQQEIDNNNNDMENNKTNFAYMQDNETIAKSVLVELAAKSYDLTSKEYLDTMRLDKCWGGGPEIVALCNVWQRPIHVYELSSTQKKIKKYDKNFKNKNWLQKIIMRNKRQQRFVLKRMTCFGSPKFNNQTALHILSTDARFPNLKPGKQAKIGDHFMAVFPLLDNDNNNKTKNINLSSLPLSFNQQVLENYPSLKEFNDNNNNGIESQHLEELISAIQANDCNIVSNKNKQNKIKQLPTRILDRIFRKKKNTKLE